jgi:hypothetical protein
MSAPASDSHIIGSMADLRAWVGGVAPKQVPYALVLTSGDHYTGS